MKFTLPYPPPELNPNRARRLHWSRVAAVRKAYRREGWLAGYAAKAAHKGQSPLRSPVTARITVVVPDHRRRDEDNLLASLKAAWDGCVDAGVLEDDSHDKFRVEVVAWRVEREKRIEVELVATEP